ncbi:MAG: hypothetical protein IT374_23935 [Polyangiaceae bacterium]|nr:hypothetical protein [Polyangiaceae bacterium]
MRPREFMPALALAISGSACLIVPIPAGSRGSGQPRSFHEAPAESAEPRPGHNALAATGAQPAAAAPPSAPASIQVHSDCPRTLPLFLGDKPKYGSGTKTSIGSNTTTSFPRKPDGTASIWILDDHENGVGQASVGPSARRVTIARNCTAITTE